MIDFHAHSNMSYCADDDLLPSFYAEFLSKEENNHIEKIVIADHGMALYFPEETAWKWQFISDSGIFDQWRDWGNQRLTRYISEIKKLGHSKIIQGFEVEMMNDGRFTLDCAFRKDIRILIGAVHYLPVSPENGFQEKDVLAFWKNHTLKLLESDIDILAHPFRWISGRAAISDSVIYEIIDATKQNGKAIEINSHFKINTDVPMLRYAVEKAVPITFGTDTHSKKQAGDFSYHLDIISAAGLNLSDINFLKI